jgi:putative MFS transporter
VIRSQRSPYGTSLLGAGAVHHINPGVFGSTGIYVSELHPTRLRATAVGWFFGIGRIGSFLAPAVIGYMLAYGLGAYVLYTFAVAYLVAAIALWFVGVETRGRVLEEINQTNPATA